MGPAVDVEMQQLDGRRHRLKDVMESDDAPRMAALQALFGFTSEQMRQVRELSTTTPWCRYLEDSFQPFLTEQYACIWATIGLPPPRAASDCWGLFSAVSRAVAKLSDADSIKDVLKSVGEDAEAEEGGLIMRADAPKECLIAVFAVL